MEPDKPEYGELAAALGAEWERRRLKIEEADRALLEQIALERSEPAFNELYLRFRPRIYAMLYHMLRVHEDVRDVMQEVFLVIWNKAPDSFSLQIKTAAWIKKIARNKAIDELRMQQSGPKKHLTRVIPDPERPELDKLDIQIEDYHTPDIDLNTKECHEELARALEQLTPEQRCILDLIYNGGLQYAEVGKKLNMPTGTVKTSVRNSVIKLRAILMPRMS